MSAAPTILTDRLVLRGLTRDDHEPIATMWGDPRTTAFIGGTPRTPSESWRAVLAGAGLWSVFGYGYWVWAERRTERLIGNGGLAWFARGIPELDGVPEAGWALAPDAWGQGYATEAMQAVLTWADAQHAFPAMRCIIDPGNVASGQVATKLGFTRVREVPFADATTVLWERSAPPSQP